MWDMISFSRPQLREKMSGLPSWERGSAERVIDNFLERLCLTLAGDKASDELLKVNALSASAIKKLRKRGFNCIQDLFETDFQSIQRVFKNSKERKWFDGKR